MSQWESEHYPAYMPSWNELMTLHRWTRTTMNVDIAVSHHTRHLADTLGHVQSGHPVPPRLSGYQDACLHAGVALALAVTEPEASRREFERVARTWAHIASLSIGAAGAVSRGERPPHSPDEDPPAS